MTRLASRGAAAIRWVGAAALCMAAACSSSNDEGPKCCDLHQAGLAGCACNGDPEGGSALAGALKPAATCDLNFQASACTLRCTSTTNDQAMTTFTGAVVAACK